ncbi:unnamed protein product [Rotaria sordida]|uniref:CCDC92/74 N-terminal domain-containing protein n=1 Tax=Rotaria sordida TaxID=392033 RepID=A0A815NAI9_9BILA|nr:unnamed protein product [Rotaria sordida]CAF1436664.1 unnamed protein product [Rotaria sordida]
MTQYAFTDKRQSFRRSFADNIDDDISKTKSKSSRIIDKNNSSSSPESNIEPGSRIEFLERNLRYIQEQQETVLIDLHNEISRLQQENRDLHYRLIKTQSSSSIEQKQTNTDQISSPSPSKSIHENQIHLKQYIDKLEKQLIESEQKNKYLIQTIDELNKTLSSKVEVPNINISNKDDIQMPIQTTNNECQHLFNMTPDKEQQYIHEIVKLRSILIEILNTEQLNIPSKILIRDYLTSTNISENSMSKTTTTPVDMLYFNENQQQKTITSSSTAGKTSLFRPELPVRRLNISPPPSIVAQKLSGQHRPIEQRLTLPPIMSGNNSALRQNQTDLNNLFHNSSSPKHDSQNQNLTKFSETSIARRERATHELQKNRLMKNLYH